MRDPVITEQGSTCERSAVTTWLRINDRDPLTNQRLKNKKLTPNRALKSIIDTLYPENLSEEQTHTMIRKIMSEQSLNRLQQKILAQSIYSKEVHSLLLPLEQYLSPGLFNRKHHHLDAGRELKQQLEKKLLTQLEQQAPENEEILDIINRANPYDHNGFSSALNEINNNIRRHFSQPLAL